MKSLEASRKSSKDIGGKVFNLFSNHPLLPSKADHHCRPPGSPSKQMVQRMMKSLFNSMAKVFTPFHLNAIPGRKTLLHCFGFEVTFIFRPHRFVADYERDRRKKPNTVGEILRDGDSGSSKVLSPEFLTHVGSFFPLVDQHEVRVGYYRCFPTGCTRGVAPDFFSQEQRAYYSLDPNTSRRRQNSANYYRSAPLHYNLSLPNIHNQSSLDACFLASLYFPLQTWEMLNKERIDYYQMR